jgi:hypothetical protein
MIECKVSRSDFLNDKKKVSRTHPVTGMGRERFYMCPSGLIREDELPEKWGLIYVSDKGRTRTVKKNYKGNCDIGCNGFTVNERDEKAMLCSALRRLHAKGKMDLIYGK